MSIVRKLQLLAANPKGHKHSPETIEKIRLAQLGKKFSEKHVEKLRQNRAGRISQPAQGLKHSPETLEKMREAQLGTKQSVERVDKSRKHPPTFLQECFKTFKDGKTIKQTAILHDVNLNTLRSRLIKQLGKEEYDRISKENSAGRQGKSSQVMVDKVARPGTMDNNKLKGPGSRHKQGNYK